MTRIALTLGLLLAAAPAVSATESGRDLKPELRVAEGAAPAIRQQTPVAPVQVDARSAKSTRVRDIRLDTSTLVIVGLIVLGVVLVATAL